MGPNRFEPGSRAILVLFAILLALAVVAGNACLVSVSDLTSIDELRANLIGWNSVHPSSGWISDWLWHQDAPFKYRILGKLPVWCFYRMGVAFGFAPEPSFYFAYLLACCMSLALALYALGLFLPRFLVDTGAVLDSRGEMLVAGTGMLLFSSSAPVLLFSKFPVHGGPNDFLGYGLMLSIVYLAWIGRWRACIAVAMLAALCRETTLLAGLMVLFIGGAPMRSRLLVVSSALAVLAALRLLLPGSYNPFEAAILNLEVPLQSLAFLFLTLGPLWVVGVLGYRLLKSDLRLDAKDPVRALVSSFPLALGLSGAITLLLARVREIRILFVLFLYVIPFAMYWLWSCRQRLLATVRSAYFGMWILAAVVLAFRVRVWLMPADAEGHQRMEAVLGTLFTGFVSDHRFNWISVTVACFFLSLLGLPLLLAGVISHRDNARR